jgi:hypothetical protein
MTSCWKPATELDHAHDLGAGMAYTEKTRIDDKSAGIRGLSTGGGVCVSTVSTVSIVCIVCNTNGGLIAPRAILGGQH